MFKTQWFLQWNACEFYCWWECFRDRTKNVYVPNLKSSKRAKHRKKLNQMSTEMKTCLTTEALRSCERAVAFQYRRHSFQRCNSIIDDGLSTQINTRYTFNGRNETERNENKQKPTTTSKYRSEWSKRKDKNKWRLTRTVCIFFGKHTVVWSSLGMYFFQRCFAFPSGSWFLLLLHTNCELFLHHCCFSAMPFFPFVPIEFCYWQ